MPYTWMVWDRRIHARSGGPVSEICLQVGRWFLPTGRRWAQGLCYLARHVCERCQRTGWKRGKVEDRTVGLPNSNPGSRGKTIFCPCEGCNGSSLSITWNPKQPETNGCSNMRQLKSFTCLGKHPFLSGCLEFQAGTRTRQTICTSSRPRTENSLSTRRIRARTNGKALVRVTPEKVRLPCVRALGAAQTDTAGPPPPGGSRDPGGVSEVGVASTRCSPSLRITLL